MSAEAMYVGTLPKTGAHYVVDSATSAVYGPSAGFPVERQAQLYAGWLFERRDGYPLSTHCDRCQTGPRMCRQDPTWGVVCPDCDAMQRCAACVLVLPVGLLRRGVDCDDTRRTRTVVTRPLCPHCVERDRAGLLGSAA